MSPRPSPFDALGKAYPVTPQQRAMMHRRVGALTNPSEVQRPLLDLLANAYAMGLADAVEVMEVRKGRQ